MQVPRLPHSIHSRPDLRGLLLVLLAGSWLAGILVDAWLLLPLPLLLSMGILALLVVCCCWAWPLPRLTGLVLLFLCLGAWRYTTVAPGNGPHTIRALIGTARLQLQGEISADPRLETRSTLLLVEVQRVSLNSAQSWQEARGQIQVQIAGSTFDDPYAPRYGDTLQLEGQLTAPPGYATPELQASMTFPKMAIKSHGGIPLLAFFYQIRAALSGILQRALPQPFAALLIAIFLSLRTPSLKPLLPLFNVTGTAHLIAPSGFKVTLLAGVIGAATRWLTPGKPPGERRLLPTERRKGNWRRWLYTLLLVLCIASYTMLSGAGPAAIRAGVMGALLVLAPRLARTYNVYTAMALTALSISLLDPLVVLDSGFQLSFAGTLGILLFTPILQHLLRFFNRLPLGSHVAELVAVTLAAQIATLPIFALSFNQISFVSPLANLASVPLLGILLVLGALICLGGLLVPLLAPVLGWLVWPLLWYMTTAISWCAHLPGAYLQVDALSPLVAWTYYALLAWLTVLLLTRWQPARKNQHQHAPLLSRRAKLALQGALALLMLLSTGILAQAAPPDQHLTIALLSSNEPAQGQALLLSAPDGETALIDEGASGAVLAQTLDTRLPFWKRSLSLFILGDTSSDNLAGGQDIVTRYQVQRVIDAGMLHPSLAYARWRDTLAARHLSYTQVRQGAQITLNSQAVFQVLWPPARLHKSSNEIHDNALVLRLLASGLRLLLLNTTALSSYALQMLASSLAPPSLQAEAVQAASETNKAFPAELNKVLTQAHPSLLLLTSTPARSYKSASKGKTPTGSNGPPAGTWEVLNGTQTGSLKLLSDGYEWNIDLSG